MRKLFATVLTIALLAGLAAAPAWAKTHKFKLLRDGSINGVMLEAGSYKLELDGENEAVITRNGDTIVKAKVEVRNLSGVRPNSVLTDGNGSIREIRFDKTVVVFVR